MCYKYIDSWDKHNETSLPAKEKLFSQLKKKSLSDGDSKHVQRVYHTRNMKNLGKYNDDFNINHVIQSIALEQNLAMNIHGWFKLNPLSFVTLSPLS